MPEGAAHGGPVQTSGVAPQRLDGWKEIAAYLRRSVRTVQRWEAQLDLPVHRLTTGQADSVYAISSELDTWLLTTKEAREADDATAPGESSAEALSKAVPLERPDTAATPAGSTGRRRHLLAGMIIVAVLVTIIAVAGWHVGVLKLTPLSGASRRTPVAATVEGRAIVFKDAAGVETGRHQFDDVFEDARSREWFTRNVAIADVDNDGATEVVVARSTHDDSGVYLFESDGRQRFHWVPTHRVQFGVAEPFGPQLYATRIFVPREPDGTFYVAAHVNLAFASVLLHFDARGMLLHEFWSDGYVLSFAQAKTASGVRSFVGTVNNELKSAGLAAFDGPPAGFAPAREDAYRCVDCPGAEAATYVALPPSRLQQRIRCWPGTTELHVDRGSGVTAQVRLGDSCSPGSGPQDEEFGYYTFDLDLNVIRTDVGNGFPSLVERLIAQKRLGLTADDRYRGESDLYPVRRWNPARRNWDLVTGPQKAAPDSRGVRH